MNQLFESYKLLKVKAGAPFAEINSAYKRMCDTYITEVCGDLAAADRMRDINAAYCYLRDRLNRAADMKERLLLNKAAAQRIWRGKVNIPFGRGGNAKQASFFVLRTYLKALMSGETENAYVYVSNYDKQFITGEGFVKWREALGGKDSVREFAIEEKEASATVSLKNGKSFPARKYRVVIIERSAETNENRRKREEKLVINENGQWRIFLGNADLREVSRVSDGLRESSKKSEKPNRLEKLAETLNVEFDIMNLNGLSKEIKKEQYRQRRYGGAFTLAVFTIEKDAGKVSTETLGAAAEEIKGSLRETDVPAFIGGTSFAVLFVGLKKKNTEQIMRRIADKISDGVEKKTGACVRVDCEVRISLKSDEAE